jgi:hypothetical protein
VLGGCAAVFARRLPAFHLDEKLTLPSPTAAGEAVALWNGLGDRAAMVEVVTPLSEADLADLAHFFAHVRE